VYACFAQAVGSQTQASETMLFMLADLFIVQEYWRQSKYLLSLSLNFDVLDKTDRYFLLSSAAKVQLWFWKSQQTRYCG
jgi:hypothetical protein